MKSGQIPAPNADFVQPFQIEGTASGAGSSASPASPTRSSGNTPIRSRTRGAAAGADDGAGGDPGGRLKYEGVFTLQTKATGRSADGGRYDLVRRHARLRAVRCAEGGRRLPGTADGAAAAGRRLWPAFTVVGARTPTATRASSSWKAPAWSTASTIISASPEQPQAGFKLAVEHGPPAGGPLPERCCSACRRRDRRGDRDTDAWRRAMICMLTSCTDEELVSTRIADERSALPPVPRGRCAGSPATV